MECGVVCGREKEKIENVESGNKTELVFLETAVLFTFANEKYTLVANFTLQYTNNRIKMIQIVVVVL